MATRFLSFVMFVFAAAVEISTAQTLSVFDVDASGFPMVKAKLYVFDKSGNPISNLSASNITVTEDGVKRPVASFKSPPPKPPTALSSILTIDISGSMCGEGLEQAKAAARAWINALPLGKSECAITTFHTENNFVQDFTKDRTKLLKTLDGINCEGGTDFNAGFIKSSAGALRVAEAGQYKRVIVFLTDGMADGNENEIIQQALKLGTTIFCVTLDNSTPAILKNVALRTGGQHFDNVTTQTQAEKIYRTILGMAQGGDPCEMEWTSGGCEISRTVEIRVSGPELSATAHYSRDSVSLPQLAFSPSSSIKFGIVKPGESVKNTLKITANFEAIRIVKITGTNDQIKIINWGGTAPPFTLRPNESRIFTIAFSPKDSAYAFARFEIESDACYGNYFYAAGGDESKNVMQQALKLLYPNSGEEFVAGNEMEIRWGGVLPEEKVRLEFSTDLGKTWTLITDTANGLRYKWRVPKISGSQCLTRVSVSTKYRNMKLKRFLWDNMTNKKLVAERLPLPEDIYSTLSLSPSGESLYLHQFREEVEYTNYWNLIYFDIPTGQKALIADTKSDSYFYGYLNEQMYTTTSVEKYKTRQIISFIKDKKVSITNATIVLELFSIVNGKFLYKINNQIYYQEGSWELKKLLTEKHIELHIPFSHPTQNIFLLHTRDADRNGDGKIDYTDPGVYHLIEFDNQFTITRKETILEETLQKEYTGFVAWREGYMLFCESTDTNGDGKVDPDDRRNDVIRSLNLTTGKIETVLPEKHELWGYRLDVHDSGLIFFADEIEENKQTKLFVYDPDQNKLKEIMNLTGGYFRSYVLSQDWRTLVFTKCTDTDRDGGIYFWKDKSQIFIVRIY
jgi:hypothetical protein